MKHIEAKHIVGHRGAGNCAPPNTLEAFQHAKDIGLEWVEFDVAVIPP